MPLTNREISWLGFNERVLQEAEDKRNPLIERFRFLGIYSSNADEFYRVRVASIKRLTNLKAKVKKSLLHEPEDILAQIKKKVVKLQKRFEATYSDLIEEAKNEYSIDIINEKQCDEEQKLEIAKYFHQTVLSSIVPIMLDDKRDFPVLKDKTIYLAVQLSKGSKAKDNKYAVIEIPRNNLPRFKVLERRNGRDSVILIEDIIRLHLKDVFSIFEFKEADAFTIKLTRDAELDVDRDDLTVSVTDQLSLSLHGRKKGEAVRFVYDRMITKDLKEFIFKKLQLKEGDNTIPGGRYHNFKDFMGFPSLGEKVNVNQKLELLPNAFDGVKSLLDTIKKKDVLLNYPYQSFISIIDLLREAAIDPDVKEIKINLYRVASTSKVINALINAVRNGKKVTVVVELLARFDEENNINWSNKLHEEGAKVIFGVPGLKVHSKLFLISRKEKGKVRNYAHIGTGNFHEGTANVYTDVSLLTADSGIADEVSKLFDFFDNNFKAKRYSNIVISPTGTRRNFVKLINQEIKNAKQGLEAEIILKLNNLVDQEMIKKLYDASKQGVKVNLIIRGICSLVPGVKNLSENIQVISVVDRFLEHSRILYFKNNGEDVLYISSADWMTRNLDNRIEVSCPIYDEDHKATLLQMLRIHLADNVKGRTLDVERYNEYMPQKGKAIRSQVEVYNYLKSITEG